MFFFTCWLAATDILHLVEILIAINSEKMPQKNKKACLFYMFILLSSEINAHH